MKVVNEEGDARAFILIVIYFSIEDVFLLNTLSVTYNVDTSDRTSDLFASTKIVNTLQNVLQNL